MNLETMPLKEIADELYDGYLQRKREVIPGYVLTRKTEYADEFMKMAQICKDLWIYPEDFLRAQLLECADYRKHYPIMMTGDVARQKCERYKELTKFDYKKVYDENARLLNHRVAIGIKPYVVLMDHMIDLEPWFRVIVTKDPVPQIIERCRRSIKITPELIEFLKSIDAPYERLYGPDEKR